MPISVVNLPHKNASGTGVHCNVENEGFVVYSNCGWRICSVSNITPETTAHDISRLVELARDAGYEQAMQTVRSVIGIES